MTHNETIYVIEYGEKKSYVKGLGHDMSGPKVETTVGNPFVAMRFTHKVATEMIVDRLQYQGKNKARRYARLVPINVTLETEDA